MLGRLRWAIRFAVMRRWTSLGVLQHVVVKLEPTAKRPEFFSLATPIHVPFRRSFGTELPPDGVEACLAAAQRARARRGAVSGRTT